MTRAKGSLLERLGIVRHTLKQDLLLFFLPFLSLIVLEMSLCRSHGDGLRRIWADLWELLKHPLHQLATLPAQRTVGLALFVAGLTTMIVSQVTLWQNYSGFVVIKRDHQLITHGLYRFTRNPIYLGALVVFTGLPIYAASPYALLAVLAMVPVLLHRITMEETMLGEHFGEDYAAYCRRTKRLIPFLY